jgi:hypothetical protein
VDQDHIKAAIGFAGLVEHPLKDWPAVVCCRSAGFDELLSHHPAARLAVAAGQVALRGNAHVAGGLPSGTDAQVQRHSLG